MASPYNVSSQDQKHAPIILGPGSGRPASLWSETGYVNPKWSWPRNHRISRFLMYSIYWGCCSSGAGLSGLFRGILSATASIISVVISEARSRGSLVIKNGTMDCSPASSAFAPFEQRHLQHPHYSNREQWPPHRPGAWLPVFRPFVLSFAFVCEWPRFLL